MRWAKSYSIVDHSLFHGGYLHRLSHRALSLYLFLVVVGDKNGRSYYSERTIGDILRFHAKDFSDACRELSDVGLIEERAPYFWVRNLNPTSDNHDLLRGETTMPETSGKDRRQYLLKQLKSIMEVK